MQVKNLITIKREEKNLSKNRLAQIIGVSQSTVTRWEQGEIKTIKNDKIISLANALGVSPAEILEIPMAEQVSFREQDMLTKFRELSEVDQEEILALIDFKLARTKAFKEVVK